LQIAVALGGNVFITSGSDDKIKKALKLGAKAGVNYHEENWEKRLIEWMKDGATYVWIALEGILFTTFSILLSREAELSLLGSPQDQFLNR
jgi:zinc-binding alcohol dehydrogenase/oxidoreductase